MGKEKLTSICLVCDSKPVLADISMLKGDSVIHSMPGEFLPEVTMSKRVGKCVVITYFALLNLASWNS